MAKYNVRKGNIYDPNSNYPFSISRSKIDLFLECPRCFYLDRRLGVGRTGMPGFSLNIAVDHLLKNEFDVLRKKGKKHLLMEKYKIDAIPYQHEELPDWRDDGYRYKGACVMNEETNLEICGIVDDIWINPKGELHIVDYKSTSTLKQIDLEDKYKQGYKKQAELYQWIFRKKGFKVSDIAYFVFANGLKGDRIFDAKLEFELEIISYKGENNWVEPTIFSIKKCLDSDEVPQQDENCEYCGYWYAREKYEDK